MRTYAMDKERKERRLFITMIAIGAILLGCIAIRTAEKIGFMRGYNYAMETIVD